MGRLERLYALTEYLRRRGAPVTVAHLATRFGVSKRSIHRDLALLREQELPIVSEPGRAGGVRLPGDWRPASLSLSDDETAALWLSVLFVMPSADPGWAQAAHSALDHVVAELPRDRLTAMLSRIVVGGAAADSLARVAHPPAAGVLATLGRGFADARPVSMRYVDAEGRRTERTVEPHGLLMQPPLWYLLAFDRLRAEPRTFRVDRIESARLEAETFEPRDPRALFPDIARDVEIARLR